MRPQPQEVRVKTYINDVSPKLRYEGPYKKAVDVAEYYGFRLVPTLKANKEDRDCTENFSCPPERVTVLREYLEKGMDAWAKPVQLCHTCKVPYQQELHFKLGALGSKKSVAEALIIHTAYIILQEYGFENVQVAINSIGGEESLERYKKELGDYFKKHMDVMGEETRQHFMNDVFAPLRSTDESLGEIQAQAPKALSFLTEECRQHLTDVLEYLESFDVPYEIENSLVGSEHYSTRTIFQLYTMQDKKNEEAESKRKILGDGERFDRLSKNAQLGRKIPAVEVTVNLERNPDGESIAQYKHNREQEPIAYVVQVGADARRGVLRVVECLRQANIPIAMSFAEERLENQMRHAESLNVGALVIIGQKEITEHTAIIRNRNTHVQKIVSQNRLPSHLKRLCGMY